MSKVGPLTRAGCAALLALFLGLRVLASGGYMPEVDHGRLTLMLCPDGKWTVSAPAMAGMGHGHAPKTAHHQQCPYAAAAATPFTGDEPGFLSLLALGRSPLVTLSLPSLTRALGLQRPHSTGPPSLPA